MKKPHAKRSKKIKKTPKPSRQSRKKSPARKNSSRTSSKGKGKKTRKPVSKTSQLGKRRKIQTKSKRKSVKVVRRTSTIARKSLGKSVSFKHNVLTIYLTGFKTFKDKVDYVRELDFSDQVQKFIDQYEDKFPRAFMVVFESGEQYFANKMSPPEMNVDYVNVKQFTLDSMIEFQDTYFIEGASDIEFDYNATFDPNLIERIRIRFFYA